MTDVARSSKYFRAVAKSLASVRIVANAIVLSPSCPAVRAVDKHTIIVHADTTAIGEAKVRVTPIEDSDGNVAFVPVDAAKAVVAMVGFVRAKYLTSNLSVLA